MIWILDYTKEPGRINYITDLKIVSKVKTENDFGINPKFYESEKELFKNEIINIVRLRLIRGLSGAYDDVLPQVDKLVDLAHNKYPELMI